MPRANTDGAGQRTALRIDRWLYYCRFYKTRVRATAAVSGGHVKINGERAVPGHRIKIGDRVDLLRDRLAYSFEVLQIPARRGPASEARRCFVEEEAVIQQRERQRAALKQDRMLMPRTAGRPDKRTRRTLRERGRQ